MGDVDAVAGVEEIEGGLEDADVGLDAGDDDLRPAGGGELFAQPEIPSAGEGVLGGGAFAECLSAS